MDVNATKVLELDPPANAFFALFRVSAASLKTTARWLWELSWDFLSSLKLSRREAYLSKLVLSTNYEKDGIHLPLR